MMTNRWLLVAAAAATLPVMGLAGEKMHVFQGTNPILFKDLSDPTVHGYQPDKYVQSYKLLYGDQAEEKIAAMKERRRDILGKKPLHKAKDTSMVPAHLKGYETLYAKDPRAAAHKWFADAKYGLFMHWGLYALDGIGVRYQMGRSLKPYWDFDPIPVKEYEQLMHHWKVENFDADFICDMAVKAGMKYVVITVKHCDGFHLWDSDSDPFNSMNAASNRDITFELARACRERGLGFIPFYEIGYECRHPHGVEQGRVDYERYAGKKEPHYAYGDDLDPTKYVDSVHEAVKELVKYDIAGLWFDGYGITKSRQELFRLQELYDIVHNAAPYYIVANKPGPTGTEDYFDTEGFFYAPGIDPNYDRNAAQGKRLEVCKSMAGGWGWHAEKHFLAHEKHSWPADRLWKELKTFNTFGANLLLNLGPRWDGSIEPEQVQTLLEVGERIQKEGYPHAVGAERDDLAQEAQEKIDLKILRGRRGGFGKQRAIVKRLAMDRQSDEYKEAMREMRRLTDLSDPENRKLLDQWYKDHPADWFIRGKQFLKPAEH